MTALKINKKVVLEAVFLLGIIALTLYSIFHEQDPAAIWACLRGADIRYLIGSIFLVLAFVLGESVILWWLFRTSGQKAKASHCCLYSFVGFFFSAITPSASGGQPMQLYFMKKDKLPLSVSTLILLIVTITYKMVLVILGLAVLVIRLPVVMHYLNPILFWCYLGIILNVICVWVMLALVFHPDWMHRMVAAMIDLVTRIFHWKRGIKLRERLDGAMEKYSQAAAFFKSHKIIVLQVLVITFLQRGCLFLVTVAACRSLGVTAGSIGLIVLLQGMISVAVDMLPFPGGVGISEALFLRIFTPLCGGTLALPVLIVSRGISYYTQLAICGIMSIFAYIKIGR